MIVLFTDFGHAGSYVGEMHLAIHDVAPDEKVIDLAHDAPTHTPKAAAYLLAALATRLPQGAYCVGVVDPGVGGARAPIIARADNRWFVGPGNGLFEIVCRRASAADLWPITWRPPVLSRSFHGRDLFAPMAARLARGEPLEPDKAQDWFGDANRPGADWPDDLAEIIHIDGFGNAITGIRLETVCQTASLQTGDHVLAPAATFGDVPPGTGFWYGNSAGLVEIAINQGNAAATFSLSAGDKAYIGTA
ncbi:MAG: S-adenosylmethionine hydrolase [Alphaproteobacteria bacterium]|jgi:S-adenosylmethionine hydrolase